MTSTITTSVHEALETRTEYCVFSLNFSLYHLHWPKLAEGLLSESRTKTERKYQLGEAYYISTYPS